MTKPAQYASLSINLVGLLSNLYGLYCVNFVYDNPYAVGFGGHFQYLTILGLTTATFAFALNVLRFMVPGSMPTAYEIVSNIATPLEGLVCVMYWSMVLYDPETLIPKDMPPIPVNVDFSLHLYPALFLWFDFLVFNIEFERSYRHIMVIYGFCVFYLLWSSYCNSKNGYWPYPFLNEFSDLGRVAFYGGCGTLCWCMYEAGAFVHSRLHPKLQVPAHKKLQ
ncbi:FAR-17a/AIG1-like protein [Radiomyces spectabilis]|uniref:FAR-17a/AIG1-like protein n=1 Tax=Radiomyces spectabilis TaxID=64574 RepID=UPI002220B03A|nr:FAR-17a/AIG1-like protein [Radiomyces spectabilis]KAI8393881.1 FAR-17a/AIG1-like protein [Radiomyces spectabilis]